jgi:hypothetical protein
MKSKVLKTDCGDWHRSWGIGTNHIGTLELDEVNNQFIWKGHQQGRHGQQWNRGQVIHFTVNDDQINITYKKHDYSRLPQKEDVMAAVTTLHQMQMQKVKK